MNPNYTKINAEEVLEDADSIFYFYQKMLHYRKANSTLIYGVFKDLKPSDEHVFMYKRSDEDNEYLILLNFSEAPIPIVRYLSDLEKWKLEICNYKKIDSEVLRAWEARVYKTK